MLKKLTPDDFISELKTLDGWSRAKERDAMEKSFNFVDFKEAFLFMTRVATKVEEMNHHPEWFNVYSKINVTLTTHDAKGVTQLDIEMARFMNQIYQS